MTKTQEKNQVAAPEKRAVTPYEEMDDLFDRMLGSGLFRPFDMGWPLWGEMRQTWREPMPKVDVLEREQDVLVTAELPGIQREELQLDVHDDSLTIKAEHKEERREEGEYHRAEIRRGSLMRRIALPTRVDADKAQAAFKDGLLQITLPKAKVEHKHRIEIR